MNATYRFFCFIKYFSIATFIVLLSASAIAGKDGKEKQSRFFEYSDYFRSAANYDDYDDEFDTLDARGWSFGLNVGAYFANQYSARFYNGEEYNENKISRILGNEYYYEDIKRAVNFSDTFVLLELPTEMAYNVAVSVGFMAKFNFSQSMGLLLSANYARLNTSDGWTAEIDPQPFLREPDIRIYPIYGIEERVMIDIGLSKIIQLSERTNLFFEAGLNFTDTKVKKHEIEIEGLTHSLVNIYGNQPYIPNTQIQTYEYKQGGIAMGAFFTGGVQFLFNEFLSMDPGVTLYWKKAKLPGYEEFKPHINLFVRFSFIDF